MAPDTEIDDFCYAPSLESFEQDERDRKKASLAKSKPQVTKERRLQMRQHSNRFRPQVK